MKINEIVCIHTISYTKHETAWELHGQLNMRNVWPKISVRNRMTSETSERPAIDLVCKRSSLVTRRVFSSKFLKQRDNWCTGKLSSHEACKRASWKLKQCWSFALIPMAWSRLNGYPRVRQLTSSITGRQEGFELWKNKAWIPLSVTQFLTKHQSRYLIYTHYINIAINHTTHVSCACMCMFC